MIDFLFINFKPITMKKLVFLFAFLGFFIAGMHCAYAQWEVDVSWNDVNCSCNDPVTKYVRVEIYTYPGNIEVNTPTWETATGTSHTSSGDDTIRTDCTSDCYLVKVFIKYVDSSGICCEGDDHATCTGQELYETYPFPNTIVLN
jgi:hypothetical protein